MGDESTAGEATVCTGYGATGSAGPMGRGASHLCLTGHYQLRLKINNSDDVLHNCHELFLEELQKQTWDLVCVEIGHR